MGISAEYATPGRENLFIQEERFQERPFALHDRAGYITLDKETLITLSKKHEIFGNMYSLPQIREMHAPIMDEG